MIFPNCAQCSQSLNWYDANEKKRWKYLCLLALVVLRLNVDLVAFKFKRSLCVCMCVLLISFTWSRIWSLNGGAVMFSQKNSPKQKILVLFDLFFFFFFSLTPFSHCVFWTFSSYLSIHSIRCWVKRTIFHIFYY